MRARGRANGRHPRPARQVREGKDRGENATWHAAQGQGGTGGGDETGLRVQLQRSKGRPCRLRAGDGGGGEGAPAGGGRTWPERDSDPPVQRRSAIADR